jgi:Glycosyl hydrolase catalytic core
VRAFVGIGAVVLGLILPQPGVGQDYRHGGVTGVNIDDCIKARELGIGFVRAGIAWWELQPSSEQPPDFSYQDFIFDCFHKGGIKIFWTLGDAPDWAGGQSTGILRHAHLPDPGRFSQFVYDVLRHYASKPYDITFGIWNEPDGVHLSGCPPGMTKGECWGQFLWLEATAARAAVDPDARLAGPEMGTLDQRYADALSYMSQSIAPQDVITTHWYDFGSLYDWMDVAIGMAGGRETWLTETGYLHCDEERQSSKMDELMSLFRGRYNPAWTKIFWYQVARNNECASIIRSDGSNKPAFSVYRSFLSHPPRPPKTPR